MDSKVKTYLFTQGNELIYESSQKDFIGWYNIDAEGNYFSGKTFESRISSLLLPIEMKKSLYQQINNSSEVASLKNQIDIQSYYPNISDLDIDAGYVDRYFARKTNVDNLLLKEIDLNTFINLQNQTGIYLDSLYSIYTIRWWIKGNLIEITNKNKEEIKRIPILNNLLKDLNEFFQN